MAGIDLSSYLFPEADLGRQSSGSYEIDWSNPITKGLVDVIDCSGPIPRSLILGLVPTSFGTVPSKNASPQGYVTDATAAFGGWYFTSSTGVHATAEQTHIMVGQYNAVTGMYAGFCCVSDGAGTDSSIAVQYIDASNVVLFPGNINLSVAQTAYLDSKSHVYVYTAKAGSFAWYKDLALVASSASFTPTTYATSRLIFGGERTLSSSYATKFKSALYIQYKRVLTTAERQALTDNPQLLFKPADSGRWLFVDVSTGSTTIACTAGAAIADGSLAAVMRILPGLVGDAAAAGVTAGVTRVIAGAVGNAAAAGTTASIVVSGSVTISAIPGNATAVGVTAVLKCTIAASVGNAVAAGATAALLRVIAAGPGNTVATGLTAAIAQSTRIAAQVGDAVAAGVPANIVISYPIGAAGHGYGRIVVSPKLAEIDYLLTLDFVSQVNANSPLVAATGSLELYSGVAGSDPAFIGAPTLSGTKFSQYITGGLVGNVYKGRVRGQAAAGQATLLTFDLTVQA